MTREERAIQILGQRACCMECVVSNFTCAECDEAFDMAIKALEQKPKTGHSFPEGATNKDIFKAIFGYEPATDSVVCNKEDWCGASEPCNYCLNNSDSIGREEDWWNAPYKPEGGQA